MGSFFNLFLIRPLFNLLALIVAVVPGHDLGLGIIIFTVLSRIALWPLFKKQLHSQRVMQAIQPELKKIKDKAKGDRQKEAALMMELYKEKGISPFSSMTPLLLQLPIFIALYAVLRHALRPGDLETLAYSGVKNLSAIKDLIAQHQSFRPSLYGLFDLGKNHNLYLAIGSAVLQYFQSKQLMPKNPDPGQLQMFRTTNIMLPLVSGFIAFTFPAALALYFLTTSAVAIFQQWLIFREDVSEMEAKAEKAK